MSQDKRRDPDGFAEAPVQTRSDDNSTQSIRESYDRLADEYARQLFNELQNKPLDRELLDRFAAKTLRRGEVTSPRL